MARPLRIEFPGAVYHLTSRGNACQPIFLDEEDRRIFLSILGQVIPRYRWRCYAYCLMDNHYHVLIDTEEPTLSAGMRQLNGVFTQRCNRRHGRVGHVFQGRFKAILVERDAHLLELCRYVVLNPVRARLVREADAWPWSSYRATVGLASVPPWLSVEGLLAHFGSDRGRAQQAYVQFVREGIRATSPWEHLRGQIYLGSEAFCQRLVSETLQPEVPRTQRQPVRPPLQELLTEGSDRKRQAARASQLYGYRLREIAECLGVHYATVSRWLRADEHEASRSDEATVMLDCKT